MDLIEAIRVGVLVPEKMRLLSAVRDGDLGRVKFLIDLGEHVNYEDSHNRTALFCVTYNDNVNIGRLLIDKGAYVNQQSIYGWTPLMHAVVNNNINIIKLLLIRGANVNQKNKDGETALDYASVDYIIKLLCWRGAKFGSKKNTKPINIEGVLLFIYCGNIPRDLLREIHTKWI
jgi:hypothetical protein